MHIKLVSFILCPFVQRAVIALREKGVAHTIEYIDLEAPPAWFLRLSPLGKVPLLLVGDEVLFESSVILDYLDEAYAPRLHPVDSLRRARHKAWIEFGSMLLGQLHGLALAGDEPAYLGKLQEFQSLLQRLEDPLGEGLFRQEGDFTLVDAAYAPLFMRLRILGGLRPELAASLQGPLAEWDQALRDRASVRDSVVADFAPRYLEFIRGKGSWLMEHA